MMTARPQRYACSMSVVAHCIEMRLLTAALGWLAALPGGVCSCVCPAWVCHQRATCGGHWVFKRCPGYLQLAARRCPSGAKGPIHVHSGTLCSTAVRFRPSEETIIYQPPSPCVIQGKGVPVSHSSWHATSVLLIGQVAWPLQGNFGQVPYTAAMAASYINVLMPAVDIRVQCIKRSHRCPSHPSRLALEAVRLQCSCTSPSVAPGHAIHTSKPTACTYSKKDPNLSLRSKPWP